jgi:hypothetical protein
MDCHKFKKDTPKNINDGKNLTKEQLVDLYDSYINYSNVCLKYKIRKYKIRLPNFPECVSENIVKTFINNKEGIYCINSKQGDLCIIEEIEGTRIKKRVEVKCFSSTGPTSFGPTEKWDLLYFLDAQNCRKNKYKIYRVNMKNTDPRFLNIKVNKKQTFKDQCKATRRPRLAFSKIKEQLEKYNDSVNMVFEGSFEDLF